MNSPDAFAMDTRNTPDDAYLFCKGEAIKMHTTSEMVKKKTPYDWAAITLFVIVAIVSAFIVSLRKPWTKIVVRVAGSWVAAKGMLMFSWLMRGQG